MSAVGAHADSQREALLSGLLLVDHVHRWFEVLFDHDVSQLDVCGSLLALAHRCFAVYRRQVRVGGSGRRGLDGRAGGGRRAGAGKESRDVSGLHIANHSRHKFESF